MLHSKFFVRIFISINNKTMKKINNITVKVLMFLSFLFMMNQVNAQNLESKVDGTYDNNLVSVFSSKVEPIYIKKLVKKLTKKGFTNITNVELGAVIVKKNSQFSNAEIGFNKAINGNVAGGVKQMFDKEEDTKELFQVNFTSNGVDYKVRLSSTVGLKYIIVK